MSRIDIQAPPQDRLTDAGAWRKRLLQDLERDWLAIWGQAQHVNGEPAKPDHGSAAHPPAMALNENEPSARSPSAMVKARAPLRADARESAAPRQHTGDSAGQSSVSRGVPADAAPGGRQAAPFTPFHDTSALSRPQPAPMAAPPAGRVRHLAEHAPPAARDTTPQSPDASLGPRPPTAWDRPAVPGVERQAQETLQRPLAQRAGATGQGTELADANAVTSRAAPWGRAVEAGRTPPPTRQDTRTSEDARLPLAPGAEHWSPPSSLAEPVTALPKQTGSLDIKGGLPVDHSAAWSTAPPHALRANGPVGSGSTATPSAVAPWVPPTTGPLAPSTPVVAAPAAVEAAPRSPRVGAQGLAPPPAPRPPPMQQKLMLREVSDQSVLASLRDARMSPELSQTAAQALALALLQAGYARVQVVVNGQQRKHEPGDMPGQAVHRADAASEPPTHLSFDAHASRHGH